METHTENASFLWGTAPLLRDGFKRGQEGAILPFTVTRRIDIVSDPTKDEVSEAYRESKARLGAEIREVQKGIAQIMEEVTA
jgi:type I restriction-modification system DNA methylase subunit